MTGSIEPRGSRSNQSNQETLSADTRRLRALTIIGPVAFVLALEVAGLTVLQRLFGGNSTLRLVVIFLILIAAVVPFSLWIFALIEGQQRDLARSAKLLSSVTDYAIFGLDPTGRVVTWSPGAERLKGYSTAEILGRPLDVFYTPEDVALGTHVKLLQEATEKGQMELEGWRLRKDGSQFWASVVSTAVRDDTGILRGFTHVVRDITERRQAAERIRGLNEELERRVRELDAAHTAVVSISSALSLADVLQTIADAARELIQSRYAAIGVANEDGEIQQFITSGITPEQRATIGPLPRGHGLLGALITDQAPIRIANIQNDPRSSGFPDNHPSMTSLLGVPILFQGRSVGDLYLTDKIGAGSFSEEDEELLLLLAGHAAVAIEHARLYEQTRQARDRLQAWSEELEERVADRTREIQRYSREMNTRVIRAQEDERKRLARELHDDTAQALSTLLINLDLLEPLIHEPNEALYRALDRIRTLTQRTLDTVRALSHDLRPTILDDFGLAAALRWFAEEFELTFGVPVHIEVEDTREALNPDLQLTLFRIMQEALTNSGKYAQATAVRVSLAFEKGHAVLRISDDGRGFDPATVLGPTRQGGLGLYGIRERAELLHGVVDLQSAEGNGTCITVSIPLATDDPAAPVPPEPVHGDAR